MDELGRMLSESAAFSAIADSFVARDLAMRGGERDALAELTNGRERHCDCCGKPFVIPSTRDNYAWTVKTGELTKRHFGNRSKLFLCSYTCMRKMEAGVTALREAALREAGKRGKPHEVVCKRCGTAFITSSNRREYCTEDCRRDSLRERDNLRRGGKHHGRVRPPDAQG